MAKSNSHTAHNQTHKAHKNGIKKLKRHRHISTKGDIRQYASFHEMLEVESPAEVLPGVSSIQEVINIDIWKSQIRVIERNYEIPHKGPFCDLMWSDPEDIET